MPPYRLTPEAQRDLDAIAEYIAIEATVERALIVLRQLRDAFRKLADMPGVGHFREDLLDQQYRFWGVYSYLIVYRWDTKPLEIVSIVHGARDLAAFFANRPI